MARLLGLETEYGLAFEGMEPGQMVSESRAVVCSYEGAYAGPWDYSKENPRQDMRGYVVNELARSAEDARYDADGPQYASIAEEHADRVLPNGGRLYNDHGHPEFSTPECLSIRDLVAYDRAGAEIVLKCAARRGRQIGKHITIYRNNTDYHGASYGTHECCLTPRAMPVESLITGLGSFLATRQVFAGAGKAVHENAYRSSAGYQLSQRADFIEVEASVDTLCRRPLVNTRDEPHASADAFRRLHVIIGDANMSEWATALKVGSLALVLDAMEAGLPMPVPLKDPVQAVRDISRDLSLSRRYDRDGAAASTAIDVQRCYLDVAARAPSALAERDWVLEEWARVLDDLERDPASASDRVDWCAKKALLDDFIAAEGVGWSAPIVQSLDLAYHDLDPEAGLARALEQQGLLQRMVSDEDVKRAMVCPPRDTRASVRGHFVSRHAGAVRSVGWAGIAFADGDDIYEFDMEPLVDGIVSDLSSRLAECRSISQTIEALRGCRAARRPVALDACG